MNPTADPTRSTRQANAKPAGWIYVIHTWDDPTKYVGQTTQPVWSRVRGHRKDKPWGPDIKPGRDGYTILRRVDSTGDIMLDAILLDLAEAEEIQRLTPSDNANRPDPQVFRDRLSATARGKAVGSARRPTQGRWAPALGAQPDHLKPIPRPPRGTPQTPRRGPTRRRGVPWRGLGVAALVIAWVVLATRVSEHTTNPTTPWVVIPMAAVLGPWATVALWARAARGGKKRRRRARR